MIRNYLKVAARTLWRDKGVTAINLVGLTIGFACCLLIGLYVYEELSYDNFHEDAERIVFVGSESAHGGRSQPTPYPLAGALQSDLPIVEQTVRVLWPGSGEVSVDGQSFVEEEGVYHVEASFFEVFSFPLRRGDPQTVLREPNTAVVTPEFAERHFPGADPVGKTFHSRRYGKHEYRIVGVAESREHSYLDFNALLSFSTLDYARTQADMWGARMFLTFAELQEGATPAQFNAQAEAVADQHLSGDNEMTFFAQPISGLYLSDLISVEGFRGDWGYIYLFLTIAGIILLLACVNYINLMTARASRRSREVGVRRTVGAGRGQVAGQFLLESGLLAGGAFVLGLGLARLALPSFNALFGTELAFGGKILSVLPLLAGAALGVGILAGSYPALYLSGFRPTAVLRGSTSEGSGGARFRKGLVVFQFTIAVALLVCTGVVYQQLQYAQEKDLGFEGEQVVILDTPRGQGEAFRNEVRAHSSVVSASLAESVPGRFNLRLGRFAGTVASAPGVGDDKTIRFRPAAVDSTYVETLGLEIVAGRPFDPARKADQTQAHILNETAARALGWTPEEAVGKRFDLDGELDGTVIGVVKDFHTASLREPIRPVVLQLHPIEGMSAGKQLAVRLAAGAIPEGLEHIRSQWDRFSEDPFEYHFLDATFADMYETERRLGRVFGFFAGLAILIACLGLFGLAAYAVERRRREVAIRKVLGATARSIVVLLSKDFLTLVVGAFVVAAPVAYLAMRRWLQDFAYHVEIGSWIFISALGTALFIALATVSTQALRAAWTDPATAIRQE